MIAAFGERAVRYADALGEIDAIVTDIAFVGNAYLEAVRCRELGRPFYGMVLADDRRAEFGTSVAREVLSQASDYDQRRVFADHLVRGILAVNGKPMSEHWVPDEAKEYVAAELLGLSDVMLVRSWNEFARQREWFERGLRRPPRPAERILAAATVPVVERLRPHIPGVVVWAPTRTASELALHAHGLEEFMGDVTFVCRADLTLPFGRGRFVAADDPHVAVALATAGAVVCPELGDPADAVAFARLGYGVVAPLTSGAHEFCADIVSWDALNAGFLPASVAAAMGRACVVRSLPEPPPAVPRIPARPAFVTDLPMVSVLTPTFNRRDDLRRMLSCLAVQTYPNIECVIVNDAGCAIDDIVAEYPFARLIKQPQNAGALVAIGVAHDNMRGSYLLILPDDDWLFPDHIDRLMTAMLRTGCAVAHGTGLLRYLERGADGEWIVTGFNATTFSQTITPTDALVSSPIGNNQVIFRASVFDDVGWFRTDTDISDNEVHSRVASKYLYAFVNQATSEFRAHAGSAGSSVDFPASLRHFYDTIAPRPDRPYLNMLRDACYRNVSTRPKGEPPFPQSVTLPKKG